MIKNQSLFELFAGIAVVILLNVISSYLFYRIDLTAEKRYTLSPATKELINELEDVVYVKVYLEGEFPAGFKRLKNAVRELLDEFRIYGHSNLEYTFINPSADPDPQTRNAVYRQLVEKGLQPTSLHFKDDEAAVSKKLIFPGAIISYMGREMPLMFLQNQMGTNSETILNNSVELLEYEMTKIIHKLSVPKEQKLAFIEGHGELSPMDVADVSMSLSEDYVVERIYLPDHLPNYLNQFDAIIIAKPDSVFTEKDKFKIDQYIMNGGKVLWLLESLMSEMDSLKNKYEIISMNRNMNLDDLLFKYGVRLNLNLIQDLECSSIPIVVPGYVGTQPQQMLLPWYFYPLVTPVSNHPVVNNIELVRLQFANTIDTIRSAKDVKKTILLHSSSYTKVVNHPVRIHLDMVKGQPDEKQFNKKNQPVCVLLEGKFQSVFTNRLSAETMAMLDSINTEFRESSLPTKMIVVADGDIIKNDVRKSDGNVYPLGYDKFTNKTFGNKSFILNAVDYLCDKSGLITIRSKEVKLRLLDKVKVKKEKKYWQSLNMILPMIFVILYGLLHNYIRKKRYAR